LQEAQPSRDKGDIGKSPEFHMKYERKCITTNNQLSS
jgi:hypothetical protein